MKTTLWLPVLFILIGSGCTIKTITLMPKEETTKVFQKLTFDSDQYAFYTMGSDQAPEAVLLIETEHLADFHSTGWKIRDKDDVLAFLRSQRSVGSLDSKRGYPVIDNEGDVKGIMYTSIEGVKVIVDKKEETFKVATADTLDKAKKASTGSACPVTKSPSGEEMMVGETSWEAFFDKFPEWEKKKNNYIPEQDAIKKLRKVDGKISISLFLGTWCPDSQGEVPKLLKVYEATDNKKISLQIYGVDRDKKDGIGVAKKHSIERVPTAVFFRDEKEIGRSGDQGRGRQEAQDGSQR